ncbi:MAG TPA: hypothetical protein VFN23_07570 [Ktedonobacteraceae bacterium]|nr:hypothetical protein [Ktedonobacteraceae bacterium]
MPTLHIYVASQVPADRQFLLQSQGSNVLIYAPTHIQLVARTYLLCKTSPKDRGLPGGDDYWNAFTTNTLQRPACPTTSWWSATDGKEESTHWTSIQWKYAVGAVGYAVAQGESTDISSNEP